MVKKAYKAYLIMGIMLIVIAISFVISVKTGFTNISFRNLSDADRLILIQLRLPRIITAMLTGWGLSVSLI